MSLSGSMDSTGFRAKARVLAAAVNHGLKAVVNTLRCFRLIDIGQLYWVSMNWKLWFLRFLVRIEIYSDSLSSGKGSDLTTAFKPWLTSMRC